MNTALNGKQNTLTAGTGISISNDVISATSYSDIFIFDKDTPISDVNTAQNNGKILYFRYYSYSTAYPVIYGPSGNIILVLEELNNQFSYMTCSSYS